MDHVIYNVHVDVLGRQSVGEGSGAKWKGVSLVDPWVSHNLVHLDTMLWVCVKQSMKKTLAIWRDRVSFNLSTEWLERTLGEAVWNGVHLIL